MTLQETGMIDSNSYITLQENDHLPNLQSFKHLCSLLESRHRIPEIAMDYGCRHGDSCRSGKDGSVKRLASVWFDIPKLQPQVLMYYFSDLSTSRCESTGEEIEYETWSATLLWKGQKVQIGEPI